MLQDARPAVMFIVGHDAELNILVHHKKYGEKARAVPRNGKQ
jgi:hypothetical protein